MPRKRIVEALRAEGVPALVEGYTNLHCLPMFQKKIAYGQSMGFPWKAGHRQVSYEKGICPIAEKLHNATYLSLAICDYDLKNQEIDLILEAFHKVWANLDYLN